MSKYNCLIIEDEPLAAELLRDYVKQVPFLELKAVCTDAIFALENLRNSAIDLIFLDIHLPGLKGLEFLDSLNDPPAVIITSAYKDYALDAFERSVLDYLLKPVRFNRFLKAVNKLDRSNTSEAPRIIGEEDKPHLFFTVGKKRVKVFLEEILYVESRREYVLIVTSDQKILTKYQLTEMETLLGKRHFLRVHRSFLVATPWISAFSGTAIEIGTISIPIGRNYKALVIEALEQPHG